MATVAVEVGKRYITNEYKSVLIISKTEHKLDSGYVVNIYTDEAQNTWTSDGAKVQFNNRTGNYSELLKGSILEADDENLQVGDNYFMYVKDSKNIFIPLTAIAKIEVDLTAETFAINDIEAFTTTANKIKQLLKAIKV